MSEDKIRLLVCKTCGSVEELPDFQGPPEYDTWLTRMADKHVNHTAAPLARIDVSEWQKQAVRDEVMIKLKDKFGLPGTGAGLGNDFYSMKSTFVDDAFACWKSFGRTLNPGHCDYKHDNKKLLAPTKDDRRELGLSVKDRPNTYLCDFCPVQRIVDQKQNEKQGLYK
jgi:hypothetical protein